MSKSSRTLLALFVLAIAAACAPRAEVVQYEPIPEPIIYDGPTGKYGK
jgi:hypothetical protein